MAAYPAYELKPRPAILTQFLYNVPDGVRTPLSTLQM